MAASIAESVCRICLGKAVHPHYCSLFSKKSLGEDLPSRVSKISGIVVNHDDGYPARMCRSCLGKFYSLEKGLAEFREKALTSYKVYSRKRSSQCIQSPITSSALARSQPPAKRSRARCLFPDDTGEFT